MTSFVLLANQRTGSTVVGNALADHPDILCYGEVFHKVLLRRAAEASRETMGAGVTRQLPLGLPVCRDEDDGARYLQMLYDQGRNFRATGFKLLYHHAREGAFSNAWDYLSDHKDIRIIHLVRPNWLEGLVSLIRASRTKTWHASNDAPVTEPFEITPERCAQYFEENLQFQAQINPVMSGHPVLEVDYSDIELRFDEAINGIYSFLGVSTREGTAPRLSKLARMGLDEELKNFSQLEATFQNTPYAKFFQRSSAAPV